MKTQHYKDNDSILILFRRKQEYLSDLINPANRLTRKLIIRKITILDKKIDIKGGNEAA